VARTSKISQDRALREKIAKLRREGRTIDQILEALEAIDVRMARSTLGEYTKQLDPIIKEMEQANLFADSIVKRMGEADSKMARMNMQMLQTIAFKLQRQVIQPTQADGKQALLTPKEVELLAKAFDHLTRAAKTDAEFVAKVREEARKEACEKAAEAAAVAGKQQGLNEDQVAFIRAEILGVEVQR
jgi:hypothetical protein